MFEVVKATTAATRFLINGAVNTSVDVVMFSGGVQGIYNSGGSTVLAQGTTNFAGSSFHQLTQQFTGSSAIGGWSILLHIDLANEGPGGSAPGFTYAVPPNSLFVDRGDGNIAPWSGQTAEILYYNNKLSAADIVYNECYLYGRYGI